MNSDIDILQKKFGKSLIINESLSKYSWFNLGGPADIFFRPESKSQLIDFLNGVKSKKFNFNILGAGSNTLIRDKGVKGVVIKLSSKFSEIKLLDENTLEVGAAALDKKVSEYAKNNNIGKMEFLSCIPGSIGGAIIMNSGCYGSNISDILLSIKVINHKGDEKELQKSEIEFYYRGSNIPKNYIIVSAKLRGTTFPKKLIDKKQKELIQKKKRISQVELKQVAVHLKITIQKKHGC